MLRGIRRNYKNIWPGHYFQSCLFFSEGRGRVVISCYNRLQWVTMRYKMLQKQSHQRTNVKVVQKAFFLKEVYGGRKLTYDFFYSFYFLFIFFRYFSFIILLFSFIFFFILFFLFLFSFSFHLVHFHFLIFLIVFFIYLFFIFSFHFDF